MTATPYFAPHIRGSEPDPIIEVVRFGNRNAANVLALTGGSWEDEGLCASGIQTAILHSRIGEDLPKDVGLILIHAIAPAGLSGLESRSRSSAPRQWSQHALAAADTRFANYIEAKSPSAPPDSSKGTPWQAQLLCRIADACFQETRRVALLDIRTGPGNYGDADIFACAGRRENDIRRAAALFRSGNLVRGPFAGGNPGEIAYGLMAALERSDLAAAVLEFGTYSMRSILTSGRGQAFYPDSEDWREGVWRQSLDVTRRALKRLAKPETMAAPLNPS